MGGTKTKLPNVYQHYPPSAEASTVNCFAQDAQGLVWIGTNKGLFSYDGYSAQQHFTFGEKSNTLIHSMLVYGECNLLLATDNGLLIYNYTTDRYEETDTDFPLRCKSDSQT